jgi:hypothetical protein
MNPVKFLIIAADPPSSAPGLLLDEDVRQIRKNLRHAELRDAVEIDFRLAARTDDLLAALLETRPQVVHFSVHGRKEGLVLVGSDGRSSHFVDAETLVELLQAFRGHLRLVVLSACFSLAHAEAILSFVDCAIGIRGQISDEGAIFFNAAFYAAIASGNSVQGAFDHARKAMRLERFDDREWPELVVRSGVDAAQLVLIPADGAGPGVGRPAASHLLVSPAVFTIPPTPPDPTLVAVMMPFSREFDATYQEIARGCGTVGLHCERADTVWEQPTVMQDVFNLIYRSAVTIVDLSGRNPNVMYECGIAHTLGRPVLPLSRGLEALPFDLAHHRILAYDPSEDGLARMRVRLESRLRSMTSQAPQVSL